MDKKLLEQITYNFREKSDEELLDIWKSNNRDNWSREAFEAAKILLTERSIELPIQDAPIESDKRDSKYAPLSSRIFSAIIDVIIIRLIYYGAGKLFAGIPRAGIFVLILFLLSYPLIWFGYFAVMGIYRNQSVGNILMGLKVVNEEGGKPSERDILIRSLCTLIPFLIFTWNKETFFHDRLSRTYITETKSYK
ncbi:MAG: RDD family protein [Ignavibacteria bacterium]|nr:RDD family protein [Ignavibacteria bacterium]